MEDITYYNFTYLFTNVLTKIDKQKKYSHFHKF